MFSRFFIDRPIFASVLSIVIVLAGVVSLRNLPLSQYPSIAPSSVQVQCSYPGASAQVVAETVAAPIEQQVNGVEQMLYMQSSSTNDGSYTLEITFEQGMNMNLAQVLVQNRVNLAMPLLPDVIKQSGVTMRKRSPDIVKVINFNSPDGTYDQLYLSNFVVTRVKDEMLRVEGVGDVFIIGQRDYSMRIWVDPDKLAARGISTDDVVNAIREQNQEAVCGYVGQEPAKPGQETQIKLSALGRLTTPEEFANIVIRITPDGRMMRLKDVARVELGAKNVDVSCRLGRQGVGGAGDFPVARHQRPRAGRPNHGQNEGAGKDVSQGCDLGDAVRFHALHAAMHRAGRTFAVRLDHPRGLRRAVVPAELAFGTDSAGGRAGGDPGHVRGDDRAWASRSTTSRSSGWCWRSASWWTTPSWWSRRSSTTSKTACRPATPPSAPCSQVSGPVIAVGLVFSAVFVPCAFITGITGQFFRQFALTIAASTIISAFNSLTLSPALAAKFLRARDKETHEPLPRFAFWLLAPLAVCIWGRQPFTGWLATMLDRLAGVLGHDVPHREAVLAVASWLLPVGGGRDWLVRRQDGHPRPRLALPRLQSRL